MTSAIFALSLGLSPGLAEAKPKTKKKAKETTPAAEEIVRKADEARGPTGSYSFLVKVKNSHSENSDRVEYKVYVKDLQYSLIETVAPDRQKGRKLLMHGENLWFYTPNIKRPTRVSLQQRLTGEIANGDIARTNFAQDYDAKLSGSEKVKGKNCYKLKLTAKSNSVTYRSIDYWVEKKTFFPVQATFFAISGKPLKSGTYSGFKPVMGKKRMTSMVIRDALQPDKKSEIEYTGHKAEKLNDSFFSKERLAE